METKRISRRRREQRKKIILLSVILLIVIIALGVLAMMLWKKETEPMIVQFEDNVSQEDKIEHPDGGGGVGITYSDEVTIDVREDRVEVLVKNPAISDQSIKAQLLVRGEVIAESELIPPGYELSWMRLDRGAAFDADLYSGVLQLSYFDEETEKEALVNTQIPVMVRIVK